MSFYSFFYKGGLGGWVRPLIENSINFLFLLNPSLSLYDLQHKKQSKFKSKLKTYKNQNVKSKMKPSVIVSLPKIYVDMALTGHYSKISVPKHRIRYQKYD